MRCGVPSNSSVCGVLAVILALGAATAASAAESSAGDSGSAAVSSDSADATKGASAVSGSTEVEAIVVTAELRPETLFDVPAPVDVVTGKSLSAFDITNMKSIVDEIPNAVLPTSPDNYDNYIYIRGIQQTDVNAPGNFGFYRNGIFAGGYRPDWGSLIDVDHVEVLAGPQGGLYGEESVGGTINVVYATPGDTLGGYLTAAEGNFGYSEFQGALNVPVSSKFAIRMTGWYQDQTQGELYNSALNTYIDKFRHDGFRFSAKADPTDNLSILWTAEYDDNEGPSIDAYAPKGVLNLLTQSPPDTRNVEARNTPDINWNQQVYLSQDVKYKSSIGTFEWLTSWSDYHMHDIEDQDMTGLDPTQALATSTVLQRHEQTRNFYTEALWFSPEDKPLTVTAGLSYFNQEFQFDRIYSTSIDLNYLSPVSSLACGAFLGNPSCPGVPGGAFPAIGSQSAKFGAPGPGTSIHTQTVSAFAQAIYHFTPKLSLTAALRYTGEWEDLNFQQYSLPGLTSGADYITALYANTFPPISLVTSDFYHNLSPSVELDYKPDGHLNLYALWSTGFRPGGFNTTTTSANLIPFGSETADNFEAGIKTVWLDGRLGLNLDGFLMDQQHLLEYEPDPLAPPQFYFYYLQNVGSSRTYGIEFTGRAQIASWWSTSATLGWEHGELTGGQSYGYALAGSALELTRTWTFNVQSLINYPLTDRYSLISSVNYHYESGGYLDITTIPWPSYSDLDATIGLGFGHASAVLYVNNAFNQRIPDFVYGNGSETLTFGTTYGLRFTVKY